MFAHNSFPRHQFCCVCILVYRVQRAKALAKQSVRFGLLSRIEPQSCSVITEACWGACTPCAHHRRFFSCAPLQGAVPTTSGQTTPGPLTSAVCLPLVARSTPGSRLSLVTRDVARRSGFEHFLTLLYLCCILVSVELLVSAAESVIRSADAPLSFKGESHTLISALHMRFVAQRHVAHYRVTGAYLYSTFFFCLSLTFSHTHIHTACRQAGCTDAEETLR